LRFDLIWEQYGAAVKQLLGCPGDLSGHTLKSHQAQIAKYAKPSKKEDPSTIKAVTNVYRTPKNKKQSASSTPARAKQARTVTSSGPQETCNETYICFVMEQTPSFNKSDDAARQRICAETFHTLAQTVFARAPMAILQPNPKKSRVRSLSSDTPEDEYPDNTFNTKEIAWDFYVSVTGWPLSGTLHVS
jgi:hypothetical protein